jgi:hypothetical protein
MSEVQFTLLADGSSDKALIPLLTRLIEGNRPDIVAQGELADFRRLRRPPVGLGNRIRASVELFPCNLLFVHRDAEHDPHETRRREIRAAVEALEEEGLIEIPTVCVVPVRMQEAWLLVDENAIRTAAGNPDGRMRLNLPRPQRIEDAPNPKELLFAALRTASGKSGRKLKDLPVAALRHRVADLMEDITVLRDLPAFAALEQELAPILVEL